MGLVQIVIDLWNDCGARIYDRCAVWTPALVKAHIVGDLLIWVAYLIIPIVLLAFVRRRKDLPFPWMFGMFALFIVGCGFTHFFEVYTVFWPRLWLAAGVKLFTAAVSLATIFALFPTMRLGLLLRSPAELEAVVRQRTAELAEANDQLEARVGERTAELARSLDKMEWLNARLSELAMTDGLTGVENRHSFDDALRLAFSFVVRHGLPVSVMLLDVDRFKSFNDTFGHPAGDGVLRTVGDLLRQNTREHDVVARYGGEEFVVLMPGTDTAGSRLLAERLLGVVAGHDWPLRPVTVSIGVATTVPGLGDAPALVEAADRALYRSKHEGRNRVMHQVDPALLPVADAGET